MKSYPRRKTDEEFVEAIRKCLHNRWQRVVRIVNASLGMVMVGFGIWMCLMIPVLLSELFSGTEYEYGIVQTGVYIGVTMGFTVGMVIISGATMAINAFLWQGTAQTQRLMLKYHDALVAHGVSPDEIKMQEESLAKAWDDEEDAVYDEI